MLQLRAEIEGLLGQTCAVGHFREARHLGAEIVSWTWTGLKLIDLLWDTPAAIELVELLRATKDDVVTADPESLVRLELVEAIVPGVLPHGGSSCAPVGWTDRVRRSAPRPVGW